MKDENFDPMQEKHMKISIDVSQIVRYSNYAYILSVISIIISLIAIYRTIDKGVEAEIIYRQNQIDEITRKLSSCIKDS